MPPSFIRVIGWVSAFFATVAAVGTVWLAVADANDHADVLRFDAAPICPTSTPLRATSDCKAELPATVVSIKVGRGKVPLRTFTLRTSTDDLVVAYLDSGPAPHVGDDADVIVWRERCVLLRSDGDGYIAALDDPATGQSNLGAGVLALLGFTVLFESVSAGSFLYFTVDRERIVAAFLLAAVPLVVTLGLRIAHAYDAVIVASIAVPVLVAGLWIVWPRLAWAKGQQPTLAQNG